MLERSDHLHNVAQRGDALTLLRSLPAGATPLVFFDPQHRTTLDQQKYGNEGARQKVRCILPQMTDDYIDQCCDELARVLRPSGYLMLWTDTVRLCQGDHHRVADRLPCVDLIVWDNLHLGMGYRSRRRGGYLLVLQKPPILTKATWRDHGIPDRWPEKVDRKIHQMIKPRGLITRLISAVTKPEDLVVDPAAGSFVVMHAARELGRNFIGCDLVSPEFIAMKEHPSCEGYQMTDTVHILRCALCSKSFSYIPHEDDKCTPGTPNQICDECCNREVAEAEEENRRYQAMVENIE